MMQSCRIGLASLVCLAVDRAFRPESEQTEAPETKDAIVGPRVSEKDPQVGSLRVFGTESGLTRARCCGCVTVRTSFLGSQEETRLR